MNKNTFFTAMLVIPPLLTVALWLIYGFPTNEPPTPPVFYVQLCMTALTIATIPLLLKFITPERCKERYPILSSARIGVFSILSSVNVLLYYLFSHSPAFFYLGVIMWLALFFAKPQTIK